MKDFHCLFLTCRSLSLSSLPLAFQYNWRVLLLLSVRQIAAGWKQKCQTLVSVVDRVVTMSRFPRSSRCMIGRHPRLFQNTDLKNVSFYYRLLLYSGGSHYVCVWLWLCKHFRLNHTTAASVSQHRGVGLHWKPFGGANLCCGKHMALLPLLLLLACS